MTWTVKKENRPVYQIETTYCDLKSRVLVKVYDNQSEQTRHLCQHRGYQYIAEGTSLDGTTVVTAGYRAWAPPAE